MNSGTQNPQIPHEEPSAGSLRRLPRNVWVVTAGSFLTDISTEMIVHLLPFFLANVLGVRTVTIGLIEGVAETTASVLKAVSGRLSDAWGRRKWPAVGGYALSTAAKPFLVLAASWPAVLAIRFVERAGKGIRTAPRDALVADSIGPGERGLAFGLHRAGDTAGAALGIGGALLVVWLVQGDAVLLGRETFRTLVWISVVPAALAVGVLAWGVREPRRHSSSHSQGEAKELPPLPAPFRRFLLIVVLFTLGNSADAFLVLRAQERGVSIVGVLGLLVGLNVVYALVAGPAGSLSDKIGRRRLLVAGWLLYVLVYLGLALVESAWLLLPLFALYGVYYGLTEGAAKALVADMVPASVRGTAYGWFNGAVGLAALPASVMAGLLWQGVGAWTGFGPAAPFLFGASLALAAVALLVAWLPEDAVT